VSYLFSIAIKYSTGIFLPIFVLAYFFKLKNKKINWDKIFSVCFLLAVITVIVATTRTTFQPWYLLVPLSIGSFIPKKYYVFIPALLASMFAISLYIPYVLLTDYAKEYPFIILTIERIGLFSVALITFLYFFKTKLLFKH
jgi:hypothetical protein